MAGYLQKGKMDPLNTLRMLNNALFHEWEGNMQEKAQPMPVHFGGKQGSPHWLVSADVRPL